MRITERTLTLDERRSELFEAYQEPVFRDVLDNEFLATKHESHVIVLDLEGGLEARGGQDLLGRVQLLIERGERTIVINLAALTKMDSAGLGELVRSYAALKKVGGAMPLVNPPQHFRRVVGAMKFL